MAGVGFVSASWRDASSSKGSCWHPSVVRNIIIIYIHINTISHPTRKQHHAGNARKRNRMDDGLFIRFVVVNLGRNIFLEQAYQSYHGSRLYDLGVFGEGSHHHDDSD